MMANLYEKKALLFLLPLISLTLNSCAVVGGIFEAGMGFGIFMVVALIVLVIAVIVRLSKSKS